MQASLLGSQARACHGAYYCAAPLRGFLRGFVLRRAVGVVRHSDAPSCLFGWPVRATVQSAVRRTGLVAGHGIAPWRAEWCMEKDPALRALAPAKNTKPQQNPLGLRKRKAARRRLGFIRI